MLFILGFLFMMFFVAFMILLSQLTPPEESDRMKTYEELLKETRIRIEKERYLSLVKKEKDDRKV